MTLPVVSFAVVFTWIYAPTLSQLAHQWATDPNYSHGFLVVPFSAYIAWRRRAALASADTAPSIAGLVVVLMSAMLFLAGELGAEIFLTRLSLVGVLAGAVGFVWGRTHLQLLAFPLVFLLFMIPLPAIVFNQITLPLQFIASSLGETLIRDAGIPVLREGNVLQLANVNLEVVEACSGIRSLVSLTMVAVILAFWRGGGWRTTGLIVAAAVPVAIFTNACRIAGTAFASSWFGAAAADGFFHAFTGVVLFGTAFAALCGLVEAVSHIERAYQNITKPMGVDV
jgi:exosortase